MMQTVWIARHGNRQDFVNPKWMETAERPFDPGLSPDGIQQAKELADRLAGENIAHIFSSPFLRTVQTSHYVAEVLDLPIKLESGVGEIFNTPFFSVTPEILPLEKIVRQFPRIDASYSSRVMARYPETKQEARERSGQAVRRLTEDFAENILIVTHGSPVVNMTRELVGDSAKVRSALCSLVKLSRQEGEWLLELNGDTSHLSQTEQKIQFHQFQQFKYLWSQFLRKKL